MADDVIHRQHLALEQALTQVGTEGLAQVTVLPAADVMTAIVEIVRQKRGERHVQASRPRR